MSLNYHDHINPIFSWSLINKSNTGISVKSRAGLEYIISSTTSERPVDGGTITLVVEIKNVYVEKILFRTHQPLTKLDKELIPLFNQRLTEMLANKHLTRTMPQTLSVSLVLKRGFVEDDDGVHSDLLGISLFMDTGINDQPGFAKDSPNALNNRLMWEQEDRQGTADKEEAVQTRCLNAETRLTVLYNDPDNLFSGFWMNILGSAKMLNKLGTYAIEPGLYITYRKGSSNCELIDKYYSFDQLADNKVLEELGIFTSKESAMKGGNTERFIAAEAESKSLRNDIDQNRRTINLLNEKVTNLNKELNKEETTVLRLTTEITFLKQNGTLKDQQQKIAIETLKQNAKPNSTASFVDICKGASLLTATGISIYKVLAT